jgi:hypothetical protein
VCGRAVGSRAKRGKLDRVVGQDAERAGGLDHDIGDGHGLNELCGLAGAAENTILGIVMGDGSGRTV